MTKFWCKTHLTLHLCSRRRWPWTVLRSAGSRRTWTPAVRTGTCTSPSRTGRPCRAAGAAQPGRRPTTTARPIPSRCWSGCIRCPAWTTAATTSTSVWATKCSTGTGRSSGTASKRCLRVSLHQNYKNFKFPFSLGRSAFFNMPCKNAIKKLHFWIPTVTWNVM